VEPITCSLSSAEAVDRTSAWAALLDLATERQGTASGVRLRLPADPDLVARAAELAVREAECCSFFSFTLAIDAKGAWLEVVAPPDGRVVLDELFAAR
jgi:hypothetical protein